MPLNYWIDLTTEDFAALDTARLIALLPVGATEQHGPHLPLSVDSRIAEALIKRAGDGLPERFPLSVLPMMHFGVSPEHADFPGTLTLSAETLIAVLTEVGRSVAAAGVRKLAILNSHGGQPQVLDIVAQRLRREAGMLVFALNAYRYWHADRHFPADEAAFGIHAGAAETSIMMAIAPETVRRDRIGANPSLAQTLRDGGFKHVRPGSRIAPFAWQSQDLNPSGAVGDARLAAADKGKKLLDAAAAALVEVLIEIDRLPPEVLKDKP